MADRADKAMETRLAAVEQAFTRLRKAIADDVAEEEPRNLKDASQKARETFRKARADAEDAKDGGSDEDTEKS